MEQADHAAITELITDIEAELRLHCARVQEFLDGTPEFPAVRDAVQRARLLRTAQALSSAISDFEELSKQN